MVEKSVTEESKVLEESVKVSQDGMLNDSN